MLLALKIGRVIIVRNAARVHVR